MFVNKKKQYALRAIYELAKHYHRGLIKMQQIASTQAIPERFLEVIMVELRNGGFIESKRGFNGGYALTVDPAIFSVGDLWRFLSRGSKPIECMAPIPESNCPFQGECVFFPMWKKVKDAMFSVLDETTFQDLLDCKQGGDRYPMALEYFN